MAHNNGDDKYKSAVQQFHLRFPVMNKEGKPQTINFVPMTDLKSGIKKTELNAKSSAGTKVAYYVKEGPAYLENNVLYFTKIPPRTKFPVKITIAAWQYGIAGELQSAEPVEQSFYIQE